MADNKSLQDIFGDIPPLMKIKRDIYDYIDAKTNNGTDESMLSNVFNLFKKSESGILLYPEFTKTKQNPYNTELYDEVSNNKIVITIPKGLKDDNRSSQPFYLKIVVEPSANRINFELGSNVEQPKDKFSKYEYSTTLVNFINNWDTSYDWRNLLKSAIVKFKKDSGKYKAELKKSENIKTLEDVLEVIDVKFDKLVEDIINKLTEDNFFRQINDDSGLSQSINNYLNDRKHINDIKKYLLNDMEDYKSNIKNLSKEIGKFIKEQEIFVKA